MLDRLLALLVLAIVLGIPLGLIFLLTGPVPDGLRVLLSTVHVGTVDCRGTLFLAALGAALAVERRHLAATAGWRAADSILIPCFNEGDNVRETIHAALAQHYPNIEVIAINDGSKDDTGAVLDALALQDPRLRVLHLAENQGKAVALRMGAIAARSEYLVCIDGDALLAPTPRPIWWRRCSKIRASAR